MDGSSLQKLRDKLPEGSAFRTAIERAIDFIAEFTDGEDPRLNHQAETGSQGRSENRSAGKH